MKPYRPANPLIWGAVLAVIVGAFAVLGNFVGASKPDNVLLETPVKAAMASFGFGALLAMFRNWFNERHH